MPLPLERGDRKIVISAVGILVVVVVVAALFGAPTRDETTGVPSTYSPASDGAKAAYLVLAQLGYNEERWELPPTELSTLDSDTSRVTLILAEPFLEGSA